ncbi:MAG: glycosyltransferase family 2 protein [Bdellovibrionota bacterium]
MTLALICLCVGFFIFGLSTWLSPLLAWIIYSWQKVSPASVTQVSKLPLSLDILIPAHGEKESLPLTLSAMRKLKHVGFSKLKLCVGLSHWVGEEALKASQLADQTIAINEPGKWRALVALIENSTADWVALVDSGTLWPEDMLIQLKDHFDDSEVMAINPRYSEAQSGIMQKFVWGLESHLKNVENLSGGPISLHGSTILYRRKELQEVITLLKGHDWWNDDVVVPLMLRKLNPSKKIIYAVNTAIVDMFPASNTSELKRRKRVLFGNLQWVQSFLPGLLKSSQLLSTLALRRIARMLWAWAISFVCLGILLLQPTLILVFAVIAATLAAMPKGRRLYEAFWVSLMMPIYFVFHKSDLGKVSWK